MALDPIPLNQLTLAVLAGGEGSRMGKPKAALHLNGRPILEGLLSRFAWTGPTLLVTAPGREHPQGWEKFDREVSDPVAGSGPLRGVMTSLESVQTSIVVIVTVDMPGIVAAHLRWFVGCLQARPELLGVMGQREHEEGTQIEPFPCAFRQEAREWMREQMAAGLRSTYRLSHTDNVAALPIPAEWPVAMWINLNRPEDLAAYEQPSMGTPPRVTGF